MTNAPAWISLIGIGTKIILGILFLLSILSFAIILDRKKVINKNFKEGEFENSKKILNEKGTFIHLNQGGETILSRLITELNRNEIHSTSLDSFTYSYKSFTNNERRNLSEGLSILATLSSNAPFIGLFGTVLGIIQSFGTLSMGNSDMNQVIYSLAEALITTAVGLFVAIPASVAYNLFTQKIKRILSEAESLKDQTISMALSQRKI